MLPPRQQPSEFAETRWALLRGLGFLSQIKQNNTAVLPSSPRLTVDAEQRLSLWNMTTFFHFNPKADARLWQLFIIVHGAHLEMSQSACVVLVLVLCFQLICTAATVRFVVPVDDQAARPKRNAALQTSLAPRRSSEEEETSPRFSISDSRVRTTWQTFLEAPRAIDPSVLRLEVPLSEVRCGLSNSGGKEGSSIGTTGCSEIMLSSSE